MKILFTAIRTSDPETLTKRLISLLLVVFCTFCLGGCAVRFYADGKMPVKIISNNENVQLLNSKVSELIDCDVARDSESAYSLLYPEVTDSETFSETAKLIYDYFPVTEGYTMELLQWDRYVGTGKNADESFMSGQYKIEFDGNLFYAFVTWRRDSEGEGFTQFRVINEEDYKEMQKKGN